MVCGLIDLWHPYPRWWSGTVESVLELLDDLVDALGRDAESSPCFGSGDGVVSGQSCSFEEDVEPYPVLVGYGFDILGHCPSRRQCPMGFYGGSEVVEAVPEVAPISVAAGCGDVVHGRSSWR